MTNFHKFTGIKKPGINQWLSVNMQLSAPLYLRTLWHYTNAVMITKWKAYCRTATSFKSE